MQIACQTENLVKLFSKVTENSIVSALEVIHHSTDSINAQKLKVLYSRGMAYE